MRLTKRLIGFQNYMLRRLTRPYSPIESQPT